MASKTHRMPSHQFSEDVPPIGKPTRKNVIYASDIAIAIVALACLALSILVVSHDYVSWYLGVANRQLIVIGFLLSIMGLCLASVTPTLFILLEARFGESTIQNYDAILRNKPLASRLSLAWRAALIIMLALPIGLSVAYKTFAGGESGMNIHTADYIPNATYFGLFRPPGIVSVTGISSFINATAAFRDETEPAANGSERSLPTFPQPYGYNILLLNESSAALLDTLHPQIVLAIQQLLATGESWTITAPVIGTVATFNKSATIDRRAFESEFVSVCTEAVEHNKLWNHEMEWLYNGWSFSLTNQLFLSDQSIQYIGLSPGIGNCTEIAPYVYLYNIYRQSCRGTWSISRGGFQLIDGSCDAAMLPWAKQQILQWHVLALPSFYKPSLMEMLTTFIGNDSAEFRGNQSEWMQPNMAISVGTMLWSRIVTLQVAPFSTETFNGSSLARISRNNTHLDHEEASVIYRIDENDYKVLYNRPTLQKSPWLYLVFATQPALLLIMLGLIALYHSIPLGKGFGMISILSGIEPRSLGGLGGASLSGELTKPAKLVMSPKQDTETNSIHYQVDTSSTAVQGNGKLVRSAIYH